jgi:adenine-specific DNA-methyltransferase
MVQLPEPTGEDSEAFKSGYKTIADIGKERIRRVINKIKQDNQDATKETKHSKKGASTETDQTLDLGFRVFKLSKSNFKVWDGRVPANGKVEKQLEDFIENLYKDGTDE